MGKMKRGDRISVQNMVASAFLYTDIDLEMLASKIPDVEYEPEQFPGAIFRMRNPKRTALIFSSGKIVCTGSRSIKEVEDAIKIIVKTLKGAGIKVTKKPKIEVQNIVASLGLGMRLNLDEIAFAVETTEYEPEQFPGLVYRMSLPETLSKKVVFLLFGSGRVVCTGAKRKKDIKIAVEKLRKELKKLGV